MGQIFLHQLCLNIVLTLFSEILYTPYKQSISVTLAEHIMLVARGNQSDMELLKPTAKDLQSLYIEHMRSFEFVPTEGIFLVCYSIVEVLSISMLQKY